MGTKSLPQGYSGWGMASSAEVKEGVELYLYSLSRTLWPVLGRTLPPPFSVVMIEWCSVSNSSSSNPLNFITTLACLREKTALWNDK
jgi:hypothetical protein